ncbi:TPA: hypothetical protein ACTYSP_004270 [Citrobacter freundii]
MFKKSVLYTLLTVILFTHANVSSASSEKESKLNHIAKCQKLLPNEQEYKIEISGYISKNAKFTGELFLSGKENKLREEDYKELKPFLDCTLNLIKGTI